MYRILPVFLRHGLMLVPMWLIAFAAIAGWIGVNFGFHNLFRDHPFEFPDRLPNVYTFDAIQHALTTSAFQIAVYATAFLGLSWSIAVLSYEHEDDPQNTHPIRRLRDLIWPMVAILGLLPIAASQFAIANADLDPHFSDAMKWEHHIIGGLLSLAGVICGLALVAIAGYGAIYLSQKTKLPQVISGVAISFFLILVFAWPAWLMPGFAFFLLLSLIMLFYALAVATPAKYRFLAVLAALGWGLICGGMPFKHKFVDLAPYYDGTKPRPSLTVLEQCRHDANRKGDAPYLTPPLEYLAAWRRNAVKGVDGKGPVFVVVALTGGGYRATYWSALVLDQLMAGFPGARGFKNSIGLVTGASGGMVTGAYLSVMTAKGVLDDTKPHAIADALDADIIDNSKDNAGILRRMFRNAKRDSLTPIVQQLFQYDLPRSFWPVGLEHDRGSVLQKQWNTIGRMSFEDVFRGPGFSPAIVFSPMLVDSGRPLLISNLDLSCIATKDTQAVELFRLFPGSESKVSLATAARMSASFPYVLPAGELPTEPQQRVVDAGYYDNDGISSAAAFLLTSDVKNWLEANVARVVILRVNAFQRASPDPCRTAEEDAVSQPSLLARISSAFSNSAARSLYWLSSPIEGAWVARETKARFANRQTIDALKLAYRPNFLSEIEFAFDEFASESWHLPENEYNDMRLALGGKDLDGEIDVRAACANKHAKDAIETLLSQP